LKFLEYTFLNCRVTICSSAVVVSSGIIPKTPKASLLVTLPGKLDYEFELLLLFAKLLLSKDSSSSIDDYSGVKSILGILTLFLETPIISLPIIAGSTSVYVASSLSQASI